MQSLYLCYLAYFVPSADKVLVNFLEIQIFLNIIQCYLSGSQQLGHKFCIIVILTIRTRILSLQFDRTHNTLRSSFSKFWTSHIL